MDVILLERVENLGQMGDVVHVKPGFARNFLLPQKKALRATEENRKTFEAQRAQLEAANLERRQEAEQVGTKMDDVSVILLRQAGEAGQLYGSVNARDIADQVTEAGYTITRRQVLLDTPIKSLGLFDVRVALHPEVVVSVTVNVARSQDEAEIQAKTGRAVIGSDEEEEEVAPEEAAEAVFEEDKVDEQAEALAEAAAELEEPAEEPREAADTEGEPAAEAEDEADKTA